jgi:ribosomal protein S18 acetylase RimI-like enzyme
MGIRILRQEDVDFAASLTVEEGWYYTPRELEVMLKLDPEGSLIFEDKEPLGFATTVTYGRTGVLGHLVVSRKGRGRKIGGSLLKAAIEYMSGRGAESILLYSANDAVKMYQKNGFRIQDEISCMHLHLDLSHRRDRSPDCLPIMKSDLSEVVEIDRDLFGDDRKSLIEVLYNEGPQHAFKIERDGRIAGFIMARHDHVGYDLGPWACLTGDAKDAQNLFWTTLSTLEDGTIYMGSFFKNADALRITENVPKVRTWRIPLMIRGKARYESDLGKLFGIAAFELG